MRWRSLSFQTDCVSLCPLIASGAARASLVARGDSTDSRGGRECGARRETAVRTASRATRACREHPAGMECPASPACEASRVGRANRERLGTPTPADRASEGRMDSPDSADREAFPVTADLPAGPDRPASLESPDSTVRTAGGREIRASLVTAACPDCPDRLEDPASSAHLGTTPCRRHRHPLAASSSRDTARRRTRPSVRREHADSGTDSHCCTSPETPRHTAPTSVRRPFA